MTSFLFKRVMIFCAVLAAVSFLSAGGRPLLPLGIMAGGLISVYKIRLYESILTALAQDKPSFVKSLVIFMFIMFLSFAVLLAAVKLDVRLFFGVAAGLASTAAVICANALTETVGLTHNNWQGK